MKTATKRFIWTNIELAFVLSTTFLVSWVTGFDHLACIVGYLVLDSAFESAYDTFKETPNA